MILGIGNDLLDIRRIEKSIERYGDRFLTRVFTECERKKSEARTMRIASYAKRFAAKEACCKALGTGISKGVWWKDMGVMNLTTGKPTLSLTGGAARALEKMTPNGYKAQIHLTITDEFPFAQAIVLIAASPIEET